MVLTRTDENELLTALHSGVFQEDGLRLFLTRLRDRTDADLCRLFLRQGTDGPWTLADTIKARSADAEAANGPSPDYDALRGGRVYAAEELPLMAGGAHARHIRVSWLGGAGGLALSLYRNRSDFRARDAALLASLSPHLAIALRAHDEMVRERRRSAIAEAGLGSFALGWILIDARGRVVDADPRGQRLIDEGRLLRRAADGRLRSPYPEAEALLEKGAPEPAAEPRAAWLSDSPPVQMLAMQPPPGVACTLAGVHCLLMLREMRNGALGNGRYLATLFSLTRSEAALAARIAEGDSLSEAADALGLTIETARNYSKRIFVKTGASGQADLVRIILNGMSMIG